MRVRGKIEYDLFDAEARTAKIFRVADPQVLGKEFINL
jgi:hypothetical protein